MLKHILTAATLVVLSSAGASAEQAASLRRLNVSGVDFDIILATPSRPTGLTYQLEKSPEALIMHLPRGMALAFEDGDTMLQTRETLGNPACAFTFGEASSPAVIYVVSKNIVGSPQR